MASKATRKRKSPVKALKEVGARRIAAGEFKAKCLGLIDEINQTGKEVVITKRGKPAAKLIPFPNTRKSLMGSLEGIIEIVGDPLDLVKPVFPLEDYDMLNDDVEFK